MPGPRRIVPVRAEVVRRKLATIREAVERLRPRASIGVEKLQQDGLLQWAVERGLQVAAKALFDAGNHILAGKRTIGDPSSSPLWDAEVRTGGRPASRGSGRSQRKLKSDFALNLLEVSERAVPLPGQ